MGKRLIFITGGCRSGKSHFALNYANDHFTSKLYLATCEALDEEMAQRVENHKKTRGPEWRTIEEPLHIADQIIEQWDHVEVILLDCITLWLSNLLMKWDDEEKIVGEVDRFMDALDQAQTSLVIVSNEVGLGIVPADPLSRRYRDLSGTVNQRIAGAAQAVIFMVSGIPLYLKGKE
jgi:adenosylcobinamide kinase / adenosylcobinamide-phosphate guanylyltransferase